MKRKTRNLRLTAQISAEVKEAAEETCEDHGWEMNRLVEEALLDKIEELKDVNNLHTIRLEPTRPFKEVQAELDLE
jgi:hypothetical protein